MTREPESYEAGRVNRKGIDPENTKKSGDYYDELGEI